MSPAGFQSAAPKSVRLRLTGGRVLREGRLRQRSVAIADGRISRGPLPEVDMSGYYILPGIVDLYGTGLDQAPDADPIARLAAAEREAAGHGITTAWLAQGWSREGGAAEPGTALAMLEAHGDYAASRALVDLRLALICDTHTVASRDALLAAVRRFRVDLVLFADRLSQLGARGPAHRPSNARLCEAADAARDVPRHLCRLAEGFDTLGVTYGSLDDRDGETRETFSMIGAKLCTRPERRSAAALARAVGDPVLVSSTAILGAGGAGADRTALDLVRHGMVNALVSDTSPGGLVRAAFALTRADILPLPEAWSLISAAPASILRLPDRGVIDYGRRADLALVNADTREVEGTLVAGRVAYLSGAAAERFILSRAEVALAAE
ncbi:alkylphosphonate utilization protein [Roseivivax marinus]|uniref:alkylphosphonate utilization protein n=1 Tax=Roseivivax marinus TaxID=1379903 RepID=UPI001F033D81|nr:alkylphosphonate utilization protein [Roseivivax marinus]UMA65135.1 alkylphosphonate utilization protein [Roseivivax marinus]